MPPAAPFYEALAASVKKELHELAEGLSMARNAVRMIMDDPATTGRWRATLMELDTGIERSIKSLRSLQSLIGPR